MLLPRNNYSFSHLFMNFTIFLAVLHVGSSFPDEGLNPCLLQGKHEVLTTGLPGRLLQIFLRVYCMPDIVLSQVQTL